LQVHDREGYWWVECASCDCGWQVAYYAESIGCSDRRCSEPITHLNC
jgi:hypothetical protein